MADKSSLLSELRIDRGKMPQPSGVPWRWVAIGVAVLVVIVAGWLLSRPSGVPVHVAIAQAVTSDGSAAGASMLDASGYVVARRQATVSSKITGKVVDVLIEEGQRVEKDQVIARLDDSNARAAFAFCESADSAGRSQPGGGRAAYENAKPVHERNVACSPRAGSARPTSINRRPVTMRPTAGLRVAVRTRGGGAGEPDDRATRAGRHRRARAIRRHRHRESRAARRDRLAHLRRRRLHPHRHRHDRRHGLARSGSGRERELHQPRASRARRRPSSSTPTPTGPFPARSSR